MYYRLLIPMTGSLNTGIITCHNIPDNGQKYFNISTVWVARNDAKWLARPRDHSLISFIEFGERGPSRLQLRVRSTFAPIPIYTCVPCPASYISRPLGRWNNAFHRTNSELSQSLDNQYFSSSSVSGERLFLDETRRDETSRDETRRNETRQGETRSTGALL